MKSLLLLLSLLAIVVYLITSYLDLPYYFESVSTGKCDYIQLANGVKLDCSHYDPNQKYIFMYSK